MASIEAAVIAALKGYPALAAIVGARVAMFGATQGAAYPYVTVQRISTQGASSLDGPSTLDRPRVQIDYWSASAVEAAAAGEAGRTALDAIEQTAGGLTFTATFQDQRGPAPEEQTRTFRVSQDYFVWCERT